ncbi:MAG TPA: methylated-DNA--[protein]-cysteine S-methyltransferase [Gemmatimonadaceae bacterium]|jgi:AraC family transcriptional regulator of adaptative response/methylated-DNA-[protein]-cysteine methyltransferase
MSGKVAATQVAWLADVDTSIGEMIAGATDTHLVLLEFARRRTLDAQLERFTRMTGFTLERGESRIVGELRRELDEYFRGERKEFTIPIDARGTPFQMRVWAALRQIPTGTTTSYGRLAMSLGQASAVRAVAGANGDNPIAILIPCHRVIGSDGSLTGYGGGLWRKKKLLELEARTEALRLPGL